jgi:lipid-A-disaccharide synthase-like uncharacterized protein
MQWLSNLFGHAEQLLGVDRGFWTVFWNVVGWLGNAAFSSRFFVQWYVAEKRKQVVVPVLFWWLSLAGSLCLLCYAVFYAKLWVVIFAYAFAWIPYTRNLVIHHQYKQACLECPSCGKTCAPSSNFCSSCGARLGVEEKNLR